MADAAVLDFDLDFLGTKRTRVLFVTLELLLRSFGGPRMHH